MVTCVPSNLLTQKPRLESFFFFSFIILIRLLSFHHSISMTTASTLTGSALQASRAAVTAAFEDQSVSSSAQEDLEPGEIQEIDMETQADSIRTVFSDPTNFNVKVCSLLQRDQVFRVKYSRFSILFTLPGLFGLTHLQARTAICLRHLQRHFPRPLFPRHRVLRRLKVGWRTSSVSLALTVWRSSGGERLNQK